MEEVQYLVNTYERWARAEGIPIIEGWSVHIPDVETAPWKRMGEGVRGALIHLTARGDWANAYVCDLPPGSSSTPQRHLYDEEIYVIRGKGTTRVWAEGVANREFRWQEDSAFAIPLNAWYQHINTSSEQEARLYSVTNAPVTMNFFHNLDFILQNPYVFAERFGPESYFKGDGTMVSIRPGKHRWETNFIPGARTCVKLQNWAARGAGGTSIQFTLAESVMAAHMSEFPVGTYKKAHFHGPGAHFIQITGRGYSLVWNKGEEKVRIDWKPGTAYAAQNFHQHFNTSNVPARYLVLGFGGLKYFTTSEQAASYEGADRGMKVGGRQIEYEDEDPEIRQLFEAELRKSGVKPRMD